jgi:hypothetical protein
VSEASIGNDVLKAEISISEVAVSWGGKIYRLTNERVLKAFDSAPSGNAMERYFVEIDGDMKSAISIFREIVPIPKDRINESIASMISQVLKTLGFEILDRRGNIGCR